MSVAIGMDRRIGSQFLKAGIGYGGSCFPKDTKGLDYISAFNGYNFTLLKSVIETNTEWPDFLQLDWQRIKSKMELPFIVFDGRNALNQEKMCSLNFYYSGVGRSLRCSS